ncbi:S-layer homology domain-containing protein [Paenibacillus tarimensis]|uniref:S-layer homology domain-containing protein n=1 Tax=Paenibacillus tarimensis TaxID=416012 RepID=UPI001F26FFCC|nr:S-layer homology domain-containing protein [Paenibacillus tarimensis]MCF2944226.1 S-layer homology domain-containing protein [Paenibacillus tarimensis]
MEVRQRTLKAGMAAVLVATTLGALPPTSGTDAHGRIGFVQSAYAADPKAPAQQFLDRMNRIHQALHAGDPADVQDVRRLRAEIAGLSFEQAAPWLDPVWSKLAEKLTGTDAEKAEKHKIFLAMLQDIGTIYFDPQLTELQAIQKKPEYAALLQEIAQAGGKDSVTIDDLVTFLFGGGAYPGVEGQVMAMLKEKPLQDIVIMMADVQQRNAFVGKAIAAVMNNEQQPLSSVLKGLEITPEDVIKTFANVRQGLTKEGPAVNAILVAYIRSETEGTAEISQDGRTHTYKLKILGRDVPKAVPVVWSKESGDAGVVVEAGGVVKLTSGTSGKAVVAAKLLNKVIFSKEVTLTAASPNPGGGGGGGGGGGPISPGPGVTAPQKGFLQDFKDKMADIIRQLKTPGITDVQRNALINEATELARKTLRDYWMYDVSPFTTVTGSKAEAVIVQDHVLEAVGLYVEARKIVEEQLTAAGISTTVISDIYFTFVYGTLSVNASELQLSEPIVKGINNAGVKTVGIMVYGLTKRLPISQFSQSVNLGVSLVTLPASVNVKPLSPVYQFGLTVGGKPESQFTTPFKVRFPVELPAGTDTEKVTVIRLSGSSYTAEGGVLHEEDGYLEESLAGYSTYTVIENNVTFRDIADVYPWAGRAIEVGAAKGITIGMAPQIFAPHYRVTRAEFSKMLVRSLNLETNDAAEQFTDVGTGEWFYPFVRVTAELGIVIGRRPGYFEPNAPITRAEMATMIHRALKHAKEAQGAEDASAALAAFADGNKVHATLKEGSAFAVENEIVTGSGGKFRPNDYASRAEAAVIIYRTLHYKK